MATVAHIFTCLRHRLPMKEREESLAVADRGLEGCAHGRPGSKRQVLLMDMETLDEFGLGPGVIKENITTRGLDVAKLARGQRLQAGTALLEVTLPCEPCGRMDDIRPGLQEALRHRRGKLCRVVEPGMIRRGDPIELIEMDAPERAGAALDGLPTGSGE
jgi:MOSC domain-containing protein YiiM